MWLARRPSMQRAKQRRLRSDERGALLVEYLVVTMVGLMLTVSLLGLGVMMVKGYSSSIKVLYTEHP
jgi:Flp pilus assembly pilin Flp